MAALTGLSRRTLRAGGTDSAGRATRTGDDLTRRARVSNRALRAGRAHGTGRSSGADRTVARSAHRAGCAGCAGRASGACGAGEASRAHQARLLRGGGGRLRVVRCRGGDGAAVHPATKVARTAKHAMRFMVETPESREIMRRDGADRVDCTLRMLGDAK